MADTVNLVDYYYVIAPDRPGEAARMLEHLKMAGVNLLAFTGFPRGKQAQLDFVPADGAAFLRALAPSLTRIDTAVQQIRQAQGRRVVSVNTFASFASMWLIPQMEAFQREHPEIDIRISASDALVDLDDPELDLALRYCRPEDAPPGSIRLFGEMTTPVVSAAIAAQARDGQAPPLRRAADLRAYTLLEEDDTRQSTEFLSWRHWLRLHGEPTLQPLRWMYLNFTYQQVQAALSGQGVVLARLPLVAESLERGELVELFGEAGRCASPFNYWLVIAPARRDRPEVQRFAEWIQAQAAVTRSMLGE